MLSNSELDLEIWRNQTVELALNKIIPCMKSCTALPLNATINLSVTTPWKRNKMRSITVT